MPIGSLIAVVLVCTVWGAGFACMKVGLAYLPPFLYVSGRFALTALCLLPWLLARGTPWRVPRRVMPGMIAIVALFTFQQSLVFLGLSCTTAGRMGVLLNTQPIITAIVAHWSLEHDRLTWGKLSGLVLASFGVFVIFRESFGAFDEKMLAGDIMALVAALAWGVQNVITKGVVRHTAPAAITLWQSAVSCACFFAISSAFEPGPVPKQPLDTVFFATSAYVVLIATVVSFVAWVWLLEHNNPSRVASFCFITPVASVFFGWLIVGEPVSRDTLAGTALVGLGIFVANFRIRRQAGDAGPPLSPA